MITFTICGIRVTITRKDLILSGPRKGLRVDFWPPKLSSYRCFNWFDIMWRLKYGYWWDDEITPDQT